MGLFCVNMHLRTDDEQALLAALARRGISEFKILSPVNGWISLYEERASMQDDDRIHELASGLSQDLQAPAITFLVHDSDIACYWLYDDGEPLDEYNSCPDYFDEDASGDESAGPSGGQTDVLIRYCRAGVDQEELAEILTEEALFAETIVEQIAAALGIDPQRAFMDYRDLVDDDGQETSDDQSTDDLEIPDFPTTGFAGMPEQFAAMLGVDSSDAETNADPLADALVQAAANDDIPEIDRLLAKGVSIESESPAPLPGGQQLAGLSQMFPGGAPKIAMTPLLAAVLHSQRSATEMLIDRGANLNYNHRLVGTPVHAATAAGNVEILQLLMERGADVNAHNPQGQTPLQALETSRTTWEQLAQVQSMLKSLGVGLPAQVQQLTNINAPADGWDACERLLKAHGAS